MIVKGSTLQTPSDVPVKNPAKRRKKVTGIAFKDISQRHEKNTKEGRIGEKSHQTSSLKADSKESKAPDPAAGSPAARSS